MQEAHAHLGLEKTVFLKKVFPRNPGKKNKYYSKEAKEHRLKGQLLRDYNELYRMEDGE